MNAETIVLRLYRRKRELEQAIQRGERGTGRNGQLMSEEAQQGAIHVLSALIDELDAIVADSK